MIIAVACCCLAWNVHAQEDVGVKVSIVIHEDGTKTVTKLDPEQHSSEETTYGMKERVLKRVVYALDENNLAQSAVVFNSKGAPERKLVFKYDPLSRLAEEQDYNLQDELLLRFVYEYGKSGKLLRIRAYDANGKEQTSATSAPQRGMH